MNGEYLLDTNIVIGLFNNDVAIMEKLSRFSNVAIPSIVLGELFFGAAKSSKHVENSLLIESFVKNIEVFDCKSETAKFYGIIKNNLLKKGKPIPENDIWIASIAVQNKLILVSRDIHFQNVDELVLEKW